MPVKVHVLLVLAALILAGCQQSAQESPPTEAEVPQPGPAVTDPGPAPGGQWEPPAETEPAGDSAPAAETPADSAPQAAPDAGTTQKNEAAAEPGTPADAQEQTATATEDGSAEVSLKLQNWDATQKLIASHKGKIVVVDFWSTSCLPCRREFPHLVALQKAHPEKVACVSVSLDYSGRKSRPPESYRESVLKFLQEQRATLDNVLSIDDPDELEQRLELAPIPLVWVYDASGQRRRTFDNGDLEGEEFTYEKDVVPFVESLLSES